MSRDVSSLPPDRLWQPTTAKWFAVVFGASLAYAIIRYHLAGDTPWGHFPLFILNKIISLAAVCFVACSYLVGKIFRWHDNDPQLRLFVIKFCGLVGFFLAGVHAFMSVILLTPGYFSKYFVVDGRLNLQGELGMVAGIVALFFLMSPAITTLPLMPKALGGWLQDSGLARIYVSDFGPARETAVEVSSATGAEIVEAATSDTRGLVRRLRQLQGETVLVIARREIIPDIVDGLGGHRPDIGDSEYSDLFLINDSILTPARVIPLKFGG